MNKGDLIDDLTSVLNKKYKGEKIAYNLAVDEDSPTNVKEWVGTGSTTLNLAIANKRGGGYPVGRIIEITGWEQSGKSLLAAHAMVSTQKKGGLAVFIDTENSVATEFWEAIGVDVEKVLYVPVDTIERVFDTMETIIEKVRASDKDRLVTIIVDSVAASTTEVEADANYEKDGWATAKAIIMSKAMRKITGMIGRERVCCIFTNQLREKLGVMFGDKSTTSGGKALQFHASVRLRLKSTGKIRRNSDNMVIGANTEATVIKNRVGPPQREAEFEIYFDRGIDDYASWLKTLKKHNLVTGGAGGWYTYEMVDPETGEVGEEVKFRSSEFNDLLENNPEVRENMEYQISEALIMQYRSQEIDYDDTVVEELEDEEKDKEKKKD